MKTNALLAASILVACEPVGDAAGDAGEHAQRDVHPFFLPTGEPDNTSAPTVVVDRDGATHAVYPAYAGGDAYYAYCGAGCAGTDDVEVVRLPTDTTVANAMIALHADGRPQVLLSTFASVIHATCTGDCTEASAWTTSEILKHDNEREVTGEAFALDPAGHPRFLMHTYVAYLGIGQDTPATWYVGCDDACTDPASWNAVQISDQIWRSSQLEIDADGHARVATVAMVADPAGTVDMGAYAECLDDCDDPASWHAQSIYPAFSSETDAVSIAPSIALATTESGAPRIVLLGEDESGHRNLVYTSCDDDCATAQWNGTILSDDDELGPGVDLALDADDHPRFVYTLDYNIAIASCDDEPCNAAEAEWTSDAVESGSEMKPDEIFLWENCNVGAWFLHSPSLALTPGGAPRVGYQARDISGGWSNPDPTKPACQAGTDMTWSRMATMPAMK
ncbi:MAG: hypothetical protein IPH07_00230 [Deltaproteobacteria bacterium]|nr:hypothetical protein [Deltaproteobacteria bacterium]MBK8238572.1 hypothetical protein [Deltaproteobacteria bacterium]MBK8717399.1 hypothetical protein [Deltaproteobacteria bacterium]MBP7286266.1 hypothetical protein [Nannocystaceae bacterium]